MPLSPIRKAGRFAFLSGQIALKNGKIVDDSVGDQTDFILGLLESYLALEG